MASCIMEKVANRRVSIIMESRADYH